MPTYSPAEQARQRAAISPATQWRREAEVRHPSAERFWSKVDRTGSCWLWTSTTNNRGYGQFRAGKRLVLAHRFAYELLVGPLDAGEQLDHDRRCPKNCVNPFPHWPNSPGSRPTTNKQNHENRVGPAKSNRNSGVRGVYWDKRRSCWYVKASHYGKQYFGGSFNSLGEAESAAIALRNELFTHNDADRGR